MDIWIISCGTLRVSAQEMYNGLSPERIASLYAVDRDGFMRISMNALLVDTGKQVVLFDPGAADFLPSKFTSAYGLEIPVSLEQSLEHLGYTSGEVTDVVFTHLHFDHASGAFVRKPGQIAKRFPNAKYHVLKEHYEYARNPDESEGGAFAMALFRQVDRIHWLEDWNADWMELKVFYGHTRGMVVPGIKSSSGWVWFVTDLIPMQGFLAPDVNSGYDLDRSLALREKREFLAGLPGGSEIIFFHDPLTDRMFYP
ncbi:MAG: MBL fold metallo-hydrolase [Bacteroidota bacterium]